MHFGNDVKYGSDGDVQTSLCKPFIDKLNCNKEKKVFQWGPKQIGGHLVRTMKKLGLLVKPLFLNFIFIFTFFLGGGDEGQFTFGNIWVIQWEHSRESINLFMKWVIQWEHFVSKNGVVQWESISKMGVIRWEQNEKNNKGVSAKQFEKVKGYNAATHPCHLVT